MMERSEQLDLNLTNLVSGEIVSLTGAGTVADENVGANKTVTVGSLALTGAGAGNYTLVITQLHLKLPQAILIFRHKSL